MGKQAHLTPRSTGLTAVSTKIVTFFVRFGLWIILLVFLALATLYSLTVPITQGEDELAHYRYISFIAETGRLPINEAERKQAWYRSDWPPLYHLLVGWAVSPLDTTRPHLKDVGESPHRRLVGEIFYPRLIIYTEDANRPWQDGILAWHIGRFISIIFAAAALVLVYLSAREADEAKRRSSEAANLITSSPLAPSPAGSSSHLLALAATALLAFTPRYLFTSAMLGDDSLFILLSAVFIWLLLRAARGDDRWWGYAAMGLTLGLSITTKYSTGLLPLVIIPVVVWQVKRRDWSWRKAIGRVALAWFFTVIGAGWWFGWIGYHFNTVAQDGWFFGLLKPLLASGPDVSMRRVFALFGGGQFTGQERPAAIQPGSFGDWWVYLFQTFWGVPVLEHDPLFPWGYLLVLLFCVRTLVGLGQLWRAASAETRLELTLLGLIVILLLPFPILRFFLTHNIPETGQGRHLLYPAAQAIPILLVLGWTSFKLPRITFQVSRFIYRASRIVPLALLLFWSIFLLAYMALIYPAPLPVRTTTFNPASIPQPLKHNFGEAIQLLGYDYFPDAKQSIINLTLYWQALKPVGENYRTQVQLVGAAGRPSFTWLSQPLNGRYPTRAWDKGDVIRDTLSLPMGGMPPGTYEIELDLLREAEDTSLTGEPLKMIQFTLPNRPPIVDASTLVDQLQYRLWAGDASARYRQTLALSWADDGQALTPNSPSATFNLQSPISWTLLDPNNQAHSPVATGESTAIFMVGADWPSGSYRLQAEYAGQSRQTEPLLTVANDYRLFGLPSPLPGGFVPLEANFANQVKLLGYVLSTRRTEPGGGLPLTLYWQSLAPVPGDYVIFDKLLDEKQQVYGGYDRLPREYYSTILWAEGEVVEDGFAVPVSPDAPSGVYNLHVGLYSLATGTPVSLPLVQDNQPTEATSVVIGPLKIGGPPPNVITSNPSPQVRLNQTLGGQITLLGYDVAEPVIKNCQVTVDNCQWSITLYWRAEAISTADYTTFLHLRDAANKTVAQKDSPPAAGRYPTGLWDKGEIIVDKIILPLTDVPAGLYTPVVGLYNLATGERLSVPGNQANEIPLESLQIGN